MKKQSPFGLFLAMFLRASVIILAIVIFLLGSALVFKVIKNGGKKGSTTVAKTTEVAQHDDLLTNTANTDVDTQQEVTTQEEVVSSVDKYIAVLNSTDIKGLAGAWSEKLGENGYTNVTADNYNVAQTTTKILVKEDGVGKDLLQYFSGAIYEVGELTSGTSTSMENFDIIIIIGTNDNILN